MPRRDRVMAEQCGKAEETAAVPRLQEEFARMSTPDEGIRGTISRMNARFGTMRADMDEMRADMDEVRAQTDRLIADVDALRARIEALEEADQNRDMPLVCIAHEARHMVIAAIFPDTPVTRRNCSALWKRACKELPRIHEVVHRLFGLDPDAWRALVDSTQAALFRGGCCDCDILTTPDALALLRTRPSAGLNPQPDHALRAIIIAVCQV